MLYSYGQPPQGGAPQGRTTITCFLSVCSDSCYYDGDDNACGFSTFVGVLAFLFCSGMIVADALFDNISSVKTRKHLVMADLGFSGRNIKDLIIKRGETCNFKAKLVVQTKSLIYQFLELQTPSITESFSGPLQQNGDGVIVFMMREIFRRMQGSSIRDLVFLSVGWFPCCFECILFSLLWMD
jgi:hypothetical protein